LRRGLELADVSAELELPSKNLRAVEWDRLDLLGSPSDADRVVRAYAAFLQVDVGAAPAREPVEEPPSQPRRPVSRPRKPVSRPRRSTRGLSLLLWIAVGAPLVIALAYVVAIALREAGDSGSSDRQPTPTSRTATPATIPNAPAAPKRKAKAKRQPAPTPPARAPVRLVLSAEQGASWVEARAGSATGSLLFQGTLADGRRIRLNGQRVWVRFGAASNVALTLNGKPAGGDLQGTVDVLVTPQGIRSA
jgi:cytoskeletal protein RodZ